MIRLGRVANDNSAISSHNKLGRANLVSGCRPQELQNGLLCEMRIHVLPVACRSPRHIKTSQSRAAHNMTYQQSRSSGDSLTCNHPQLQCCCEASAVPQQLLAHHHHRLHRHRIVNAAAPNGTSHATRNDNAATTQRQRSDNASLTQRHHSNNATTRTDRRSPTEADTAKNAVATHCNAICSCIQCTTPAT